MRRMYLLGISVVLAALLGLTACVPAGGGMMNGQGSTMGSGGQMGSGGTMGSSMMGPGMMGGWGVGNPDAEQITIDEAAEAVEHYLSAYGQDLALAEVMEFA